MNLDLEAMKAAARAATPGTWANKDGRILPENYVLTGAPIATVHARKKAGMQQGNGDLIAAANPAAVLALIERLKRAEAAIRKQAAAARMGMDAAKANGAAMLRQAERLHGQSNPDALASERAANAELTEENERLQKALDEARAELRRIYNEQAEAVGFDLGASAPDPDCWKCHRALVAAGTFPAPRMILCPICGNKRCPKASDHDLACTGSNEPGQPGSIY